MDKEDDLPDEDRTFEEQADIYYKAEQYIDAFQYYTKALEENPSRVKLLIRQGNCLFKLKRYDEALGIYKEALKTQPQLVAAYNGICDVYISTGKYIAANSIIEAVYAQNLQNSISYGHKGRILYWQGNDNSALKAFDDAILGTNSARSLASYYYNKALVLVRLRRYDEALHMYYEASLRGLKEPIPQEIRRNVSQKQKDEISRKGYDLLRNSQAKEALELFDLALLLDETFLSAYLGKGQAYLSLQQYEQTLQIFDKAIKLQPHSLPALIGKGEALRNLGKYEDALVSYNEVLQHNPPLFQRIVAWVGKGEALRNLGKYEDALVSYNEVLQHNPPLSVAWTGSGHALYAQNREDEALQAYTYAIQYGTKEAQCYSNVGKILASKGDYKTAQQRYKQALDLDPDLISALLGLGDIQTILKHNRKATELYDKAFALLQAEQSSEMLWSLIHLTLASARPVDLQFALLSRFILQAPQGTRSTQALKNIGALHQQLFDPQFVPIEKLQANVRKLAHILASLPVDNRADALSHVTHDDIRTVQMLIQLEPFALAGLGTLAYTLTRQLKPELSMTDLFTDYYLVLDSYGVPAEDADWLHSQTLVVEQRYREARSVLTKLVKQRPAPDIYWLLAEVLEKLKASPQRQRKILQHFLRVASDNDKRKGPAWLRIGQLYEQQQDYHAALQAYEQAEHCYEQTEQRISIAPLLQAYRAGRWETIPGFATHEDFAFPPVVVIDLESEYRPDAPLGSTVFEVGAVCMKGRSRLHAYQAVIQRDFVSSKVADQQDAAKPVAQVIEEVRAFIEQSQQNLAQAILVGHNFQAFDAPHLRALGLPIEDEQIIDTLTFARLLHPDSMHHNLALLCAKYQVPLEEAHHALPDAQACAYLLHALGSELIARGEGFLAGFRAFVPVNSAFDRAVLQPRKQAASPDVPWALDPTPSPVQILTLVQEATPSPQLLHAVQQGCDAFVERFDPQGTYAGALPKDRKIVVTVATRRRLEQILAVTHERTDLFVLPNPRTLLCPDRVRESIKCEEDPQVKLALFCLYQAAHNHDASTLYPVRLPVGVVKLSEANEEIQATHNSNGLIIKLRQLLMAACCTGNKDHTEHCPAYQAACEANEKSMLILATHENFLHQPRQSTGDVLIVDDIDDLQMHFAEYLADRLTAQELFNQSKDVHDLIDRFLSYYVAKHLDTAVLHERLPLSRIAYDITQVQDKQGKSLLERLREHGQIGSRVANTLEHFCGASSQQAEPINVHAYWLDLIFRPEHIGMGSKLERWGFYGINKDMRQAFKKCFWQPFRQHILCGTAVALGGTKTQFLQRFFNIPTDVPFFQDQRKPLQVYIPDKETVRPFSSLARRSWAESAGKFLYRLALSSPQRSIAVSLHASAISEALALALAANVKHTHRRVLSPQLGWTTTKMGSYLSGDAQPLIAFIPPRLRRVALDDPVEIEVTGPLRFLNQQDPLVAAQMRAFLAQNQEIKDGYFTAYLLPQALLELKARTSSQADAHIILDSSLNHTLYRDEVSSLFQHEVLHTWSVLFDDIPVPDLFKETLSKELAKHFMQRNTNDEELYETLHTYWGEEKSFRTSPLDQKAIIQRVFEQKDQLVIAATGGGKSLCFQLPAILLAQDIVPKVTLVISPLIALMQDQIEALRRQGVFSAMVLNSTLSSVERSRYIPGIKRGDYSIIYIAPEQVYSAALGEALDGREIGLIAIDEAHCVSQWGHNFRTAYFKLNDWITTQICRNHQRDFPLLALTATARKGHPAANEKDTIEDIIEKLGLNLNPHEVEQTSPERPELEFRVEQIAVPCPECHHPSLGKSDVRCEKCKKLFKVEKERIRQEKKSKLIGLLTSTANDGLRNRWDQPSSTKRQRGIIYCRTRAETEKVYRDIQQAIPGLRVYFYHAGLETEERAAIYHHFISNEDNRLDIVVATNAFGMGIDARQLGFVIHFDVPATLEAYYQEAGRAGRDAEFSSENRAQCILFYHISDREGQRWLNSQNRSTDEEMEAVYQALGQIRGSSGRSEILVTESELQCLSGVETAKIATILYYLEYYTRADGKPVLERRENSPKLWQLQFEQGYQERINHPDLSPGSKQLINAFCHSPQFQLKKEHTVIINIDELAAHLDWKRQIVEDEKKNLVNRHIIADATDAYVQWNKNKAECISCINSLTKSILVLLNSVKDGRALRNGEYIEVSLQDVYASGKVDATDLPEANFTAFLSELQKADAGDAQLFTVFKKSIPQGSYRLRLKMPSGGSLQEHITSIRRNLRQQLQEVAQHFGRDTVHEKHAPDTLCYIDLLAVKPDYVGRRKLKQVLDLLKALGLLTFLVEKKHETVMRVAFLQDTVSINALKIDLTALRLVERYGERKLDLMHEYAMGSEKERRQLLHAYFFGQKPLIEPFAPLAHLTKEQKELVMLESGYHLIQAPAGSGKSLVLQEHFRYLVEDQLVPSDRILVTAHQHGAIDRLDHQVEYLQRPSRPIPTKTLHSLGEGILRENRHLLMGVDQQPYFRPDKKYSLLTGGWNTKDTKESETVSATLSKLYSQGQMILQYLPVGMKHPQLSGTYQQNDEKERQYLKAISLFRSLGIFPASAPSYTEIDAALQSVTPKNTWLQENLALYYTVYISYQLMQRECGFYTFDDQILFALAILRAHPELVEDWQRKYEHIIVDEFQDLNPAKAELIGMLSHKYHNVLAVGDVTQRILMNFAEEVALDKTFDLMSTVSSMHKHTLTTNFRSVQEILDFAQAIPNLPQRYQQKQKSACVSRGFKPTLVYVTGQKLSIPAGNKDVNKSILQVMIDAALDYNDKLPLEDVGSIALLTAKSALTHHIRTYLQKIGRSFATLEYQHRYQTYPVKRYLAYLRLIQDESQDENVAFLMKSCLSPYFTTNQIARLKGIAEQCGQTLLETACDQDISARVGAGVEHWSALQRHIEAIRPYTLDSLCKDVWPSIRALLQPPEVQQSEEPSSISASEGENEELEEILRELGEKTVQDALKNIDHFISFVEENKAHRKLVVATIDSAKSQDFDTVFLIGADQLQEGRRWYVSITRAKQRFFALVDASSSISTHRILSQIPEKYYDVLSFPEK